MCRVLDVDPEELITIDPDVPHEVIRKIKTIIDGEWHDFFEITISVLTLSRYADPAELAEIKGELKNLHRHILKKINL